MIDAYASHAHLLDHLAPIWVRLGHWNRGVFAVGSRQLVDYAATLGVDAEFSSYHQHPYGGPTLVANNHDLGEVNRAKPAILVEHGAGQTYIDLPDHGSYSGGERKRPVDLFLTLNDMTAARERARNPEAHVVVVGAPKLDRWCHPHPKTPHERPVVAFCWHWGGPFPETAETFTYWRNAVRLLHDTREVEVLGHAHPRLYDEAARYYARWGIPSTRSLDEVFTRADLVVVDNSSAGPEAAFVGLPVLWLDACPPYRREINHGGRFWEWPRGQVTCDDPDRLPEAVAAALTDPVEVQRARAFMVDSIYPAETRGRGALLAAQAITARFACSPTRA